jgi:catechol 2,3-dioxygenase-like lactoylglutathione lyase family enzyme
MTIKSVFHVNINCTDFEKSKQFYEMLGFKSVFDLGEGGSEEMGKGLGDPSAKGKASIMMLDPDNSRGCRLDLIEWTNPKTKGSPPPDLFHAGMARLCLYCTDLDGHVAQLKAAGVELVSEPVNMRKDTRFVCFKDPDGTFIELIEFARR